MLVDGSFPSTFGGLIPAKFVMCYDILFYHSSTTSRFRSTGGAGKLGIANLLDVVVRSLLLSLQTLMAALNYWQVLSMLLPWIFRTDSICIHQKIYKVKILVLFGKDFVHCEPLPPKRFFKKYQDFIAKLVARGITICVVRETPKERTMRRQYITEQVDNITWHTIFPDAFSEEELNEEREYLTESGYTRQPTTEYEIWTKIN